MSDNIYKPYLMEIENIIEETPDVRTFRLKFKNSEEAENSHSKRGNSVNIQFWEKESQLFAWHHHLHEKDI
jgi:NAD(P)H-flavin reductase